MVSYKAIEVSSSIPDTKLRRAVKNGTLSLTADELRGTGAKLLLHPESHSKALKARNANRGVRLSITNHEIKKGVRKLQGGSIWDKIKSGFNWLKKSGILSAAADAAIAPLSALTGQPALVGAARNGLKQLTGVGMHPDSDSDTEGGRLTLSDVKSGAKRALGYAKRKGILTDAIDQGESYLLRKATKPEHSEMIKTVRGAIRAKYGVGVASNKKTVKFAKGSPEAKAHMAKLRAMRKTKTGGSFRISGGSFRLSGEH